MTVHGLSPAPGVPSAVLEKSVMHNHDARTHAKPGQRQILAGAMLEEVVGSVLFDALHFPPMLNLVLWLADSSVDTKV